MSDYVLKCALAKDYAPLVWRLRNGIELTEPERHFLADFLEGKRQGRGRARSPRSEWQARKVFELFYWLTEHEGRQRDHAYDETGEILKISRRKVIDDVNLAIATGHAASVEAADKALRNAISEIEDPEERSVMNQMLARIRAHVLSGESGSISAWK